LILLPPSIDILSDFVSSLLSNFESFDVFRENNDAASEKLLYLSSFT
jgi:hypothetical protein